MTGNGLPSGYQLKQLGDAYYVTSTHAVLEFSRLVDHRDGLAADVLATAMDTGAQHWSRLTLGGPRSRSELVKRLHEEAPGVLWSTMLDVACRAVVEAYRTGTPSIQLIGDPPVDQARWLVEGLIPLRVATILYGDGGAGKSITALALALAGLRGQDLGASPRLRVRPIASVLYLDWEADQHATWRRLRALCRADGIAIPEGLRYLRMDRPLSDMISGVRRECAEHSAELVIVDSLAPAAGPLPEGSDAATRAMGALRSLGATTLVVAHVTKAAAEGGGQARPYGSVFYRNLARSTVEATAEGSDNTLTVTYRHDKNNEGLKVPALGLTFTYSGTEDAPEIAVEADTPDPAKLGLPAQILEALKAGKQTAPSLAEELGIPINQVRNILDRLANRTKVVRLHESGGGKGHKTQWALVDANRTT